MLRRLTVGFFILACAGAFAACSSSYNTVPSSGGVPGVGPNFVTNTVYVSNTTQNVIEIYTPNPAPSATPQYVIGGANTNLNGPLYLTFDNNGFLLVTNYNPGTQAASITIYAKFATGNVLPFGGLSQSLSQPHGIVTEPDGTIAVANTSTSGSVTSTIVVYTPFNSGSGGFLQAVIGGNLTNLNFPIGIAVDSNKNIFVANHNSAAITAYALPSPTPTPTSTPTPTPTPSGSPSPTPTPIPVTNNTPPIVTISGALTGMVSPVGLAIDKNNAIYVTDPDNGTPSVRIFAAGSNGNVAPARVISGALTQLNNPVDVKVDASLNIYVVDSGANKLLIFAPNASGNVAPTAAITLPAGSGTGLALSP